MRPKLDRITEAKMASDSRTVSSFLFCKEDGQAMKFFIRPSATKARIKTLVHESGGIVSSKLVGSDADWIKLAAEGDTVSSDDYLKVEYIDDCIAANELLPTDKYRLSHQRRPPSPSSSMISNVSIIGRQKYSSAEDDAILVYLAKHRNYSYAGNQVWKKMELLKITDHSWQSMRYRFLKKLENSFPSYVKSQEAKEVASSSKAQATLATKTKAASASNAESSINATEGSGSNSDFDKYLMAEAGKHSSKKPRASSEDAEDEESDLNQDKELPSGTHPKKLSLRSHKVTSNGVAGHSRRWKHIVGDAVDSSDEEGPLSFRTHKSRKRYSPDNDSEELVLGVLSEPAPDNDGDKGSTAASKARALLDDDDSEDLQTLDTSSEDRQAFEDGVLRTTRFIERAMKKYSISDKTVRHVLYIHSGDFDMAREHLKTRQLPEGLAAWTMEDDSKLNSLNSKDIKELINKYGLETVMKRQAFFVTVL